MLRPLHVCADPGCAELCSGTYCEKHARPKRQWTRRPDTRPSANARGYDYDWRKTRAAFLKAHPWCMADECTEKATDVDHIMPRAKGGTDEWDNLQALCHSHHSSKTARESGGRQGGIESL